MSGDLRCLVAEAICNATAFGESFPYSTLNEREREAWLRTADAAIAVIQVKKTGAR